MKRKIFLICILLMLLGVYFTLPKEKITNKDYKLKNDNAMAVMVYDEQQDSYIKKSSIPVGKYLLNEEKSYCTYGGEITHYNRTTGTIKYKLNIGEKCYLYFDTDLTPAYAVYSETDNSLIFYKNNDSVTEGSEYNGRVVTAKYDDIEDSVYTYDSNTATPSTPWYEYASVIKTVSVANKIMPISTAMWFRKVQNVESIDLTNLDTSKVITMQRMFDNAGELSTKFSLNLGTGFDTSNVTNMRTMFQKTGYSALDFTLDLEDKFDTSKVTDMGHMFFKTGYTSANFTLNIKSKFDTSNVTNMGYMFSQTGYNSQVFTLDLGSKFNTSNVTNMNEMFWAVGYNSPIFTLNLGNDFDTSKITSLFAMFETAGYNSKCFSLDLGDKFDTSKVTDMTAAFNKIGQLSTILKLDLGSKFDTSKVTNMRAMFQCVGYSNPNFTLDLGDKFDTSKVTNMMYMFFKTGYSNSNFQLNLQDFVILPNCDLSYLVSYSASKIILGEGWSNATLVSQMFYKDSSTPIEIVNAPANIQKYNFAADNRVPTFTTM